MGPNSRHRDLWLYRDVQHSTRRIVLRARCVDYSRSLWSCDVYVLTHEPNLDGEGQVCEELYHRHLMDTFENPVQAHLRGLQAGLDWIGTQHDLPAPAP
jgi:hypothetical protein